MGLGLQYGDGFCKLFLLQACQCYLELIIMMIYGKSAILVLRMALLSEIWRDILLLRSDPGLRYAEICAPSPTFLLCYILYRSGRS